MLLQRDLEFMKVEHPRQIAVLVGEFYEQLAHKIFGGERLHFAAQVYREQFCFNFASKFKDNSIIPPDLYIPESKAVIEVKASQKASTFKLRLSQIETFQELIRDISAFRDLRFCFFRYNFRGMMNEMPSVERIAEILFEKTESMALVDFCLIERLIATARKHLTPYGSFGNYTSWTGEPLFMLKQRFFRDLMENPSKLCGELGIDHTELKVDYSPVSDFHFLDHVMHFDSVFAFVTEADKEASFCLGLDRAFKILV